MKNHTIFQALNLIRSELRHLPNSFRWLSKTGFDLPGYHVTKNVGVVRGITVRSRSALGNLAGSIQSFFGGNITIYTDLCEHARAEAFELMEQHAQQMGANAIIGVRYDANEVMEGITEVLAYGTAVVVERG